MEKISRRMENRVIQANSIRWKMILCKWTLWNKILGGKPALPTTMALFMCSSFNNAIFSNILERPQLKVMYGGLALICNVWEFVWSGLQCCRMNRKLFWKTRPSMISDYHFLSLTHKHATCCIPEPRMSFFILVCEVWNRQS